MKKNFILFAIISLLTISANAQLRFIESETDINDKKTNRKNDDTPKRSKVTGKYVEFNKLGVEKSLKDNDHEAALSLFGKAIEDNPECYICRYNYGRSLLKLNRLDESIGVFTQLTKTVPDFADSYASIGEALNLKKRFEQSVPFFEKALELSPKDAITLNNYGTCLDNLGKYKKAVKYFDKAIKQNPKLVEAHSSRGVTLFRLGKAKESYKSLIKANKLNPKDPETHNSLGVVLDFLGKKKKAYEHYKEAIRLRPTFGKAIYNLSLHYLGRNRRDDAIAQLKTLEKLDYQLSRNLRKAIWGKYVLDVSDVKKKKK